MFELLNCRYTFISRTVQKEGANKGRQFYCCSKPQGNQCTFFKWADDDSSGNTSNWNDNGRKRSYRGRGRGSRRSRGSRGSRGGYRRKRTKTQDTDQGFIRISFSSSLYIFDCLVFIN